MSNVVPREPIAVPLGSLYNKNVFLSWHSTWEWMIPDGKYTLCPRRCCCVLCAHKQSNLCMDILSGQKETLKNVFVKIVSIHRLTKRLVSFLTV